MTSEGALSYFDPHVLAKLQNLRIRARTVAEGFIGGLHRSPFRGQSLEFSEHREYSSGDELKLIDWKVYARSDRFFVKQFEEETNLKVVFLLDASGSMAYQSQASAFSKYDYCATLSASLAYLALQQGDVAGLSLLHVSNPKFIPPRSALSHLNTLVEEMVRIRPSESTALSQSLESVAHQLKKRSMLILVSDLLDDPEAVLRSVKLLKFKKHEVRVIQVLDRAEKEFPFEGNIRFDSLEGGKPLFLEAESYRKEYLAAMENLIENYRASLRRIGIDHHFVLTDEPLDRVIRSILKHH